MAGKILCLYSGSLNSAGALWSVLANEKYLDMQVRVHFVQQLDYTNLAYARSLAVRATLPLFEQYFNRKLNYTENSMDFTCLPSPSNLPSTHDSLAFMAGSIAHLEPGISLIVMGRQSVNLNYDINRSLAIFNGLKMHRDTPTKAEFIFPNQNRSLQQIWQMLPHVIREQTWSCRHPIYTKVDDISFNAIPCSQCSKCLLRKQLMSTQHE